MCIIVVIMNQIIPSGFDHRMRRNEICCPGVESIDTSNRFLYNTMFIQLLMMRATRVGTKATAAIRSTIETEWIIQI